MVGSIYFGQFTYGHYTHCEQTTKQAFWAPAQVTRQNKTQRAKQEP